MFATESGLEPDEKVTRDRFGFGSNRANLCALLGSREMLENSLGLNAIKARLRIVVKVEIITFAWAFARLKLKLGRIKYSWKDCLRVQNKLIARH